MPILSAAHASLAVRWETMDTMVCSIFSGVKSDVCASIDRLRVPVNLEICSLADAIIPASGPVVVAVVVVVVMVVVVGSVGGWKVVVVVVVGPGETMAGDGVSPARGPRAKLFSDRV